MRKLLVGCLLGAMVCFGTWANALADGGVVNETYNTAFHVWDVCCRGVDKCCDPCKPCCEPCCKPCCEVETCTPEPCCPVPEKCCPEPVCEYPGPCDRETGEFARNTRSRSGA
jgi:hypothetical protein